MAIQSRRSCSVCGNKKIGVWALTVDCTNCRKQWKAYYAGATPVSPLMRAITAEQIERVANSHNQSLGHTRSKHDLTLNS